MVRPRLEGGVKGTVAGVLGVWGTALALGVPTDGVVVRAVMETGRGTTRGALTTLGVGRGLVATEMDFGGESPRVGGRADFTLMSRNTTV